MAANKLDANVHLHRTLEAVRSLIVLTQYNAAVSSVTFGVVSSLKIKFQLPPAYEVRGKAYCFHRCLFVHIWGGVTPSGRWGVPPHHQDSMGYPPPSGLDGWMGVLPISGSRASTCYAAGGIPLALTQEDFLVSIGYFVNTPSTRTVKFQCFFHGCKIFPIP